MQGMFSRRCVRICSFLCALLGGFAPDLARAYDIRPDLWIADGTVNASLVHGNNLYLGGTFAYVGPLTGPAVPIDGATGALVGNFPRFDANYPDQPTINAIIPDGAGGWYVGGYFHTVGGVARNHLAHITASNTLDASFTPNPGQVVTALSLSGSTLYVGGGFTTMNGSSRLRAAAVNAATGALLGWNPAPNGAVNAMMVTGGALYVGGAFTSIDGQLRNRIASFNAATGVISGWNPNANGAVQAFATDGSKIYAGGGFSNIGGAARAWLAALEPVTGNALAWNPNPVTGVGSGISSIVVNGATVYVAGSFSTIGGQSRNSVAAVDTSNGVPSAWNPNPNALARALAVSGSTVYLGGDFSTVGGQPRLRFAAVDNVSGAPASWTAHTSSDVAYTASFSVLTLATDAGTVYLGGTFSSVGGALRTNLAALDLTSGAATAWNPGANNNVAAFAASATTLYVGGTFTNAGGASRGRLAAFDLTTGNLATWNPNATSATVSALAVAGPTVYAGGSFGTVGGQSRSGLAAIDAVSGAVTAWNPSPSGGQTLALATSGSTVYAGGGFTNIGGQPRSFIAALDATSGLATAWNPGANNQVNALMVDGSTVYAGGFFTTIGGQSRNRVAALDAATGSATSWNPNANGAVAALARSATAIYVGGSFTAVGGQTRSFMGTVDATTGLATGLNPAPFSNVNTIAPNGPTVYASGTFPRVDLQPRHRIAGVVTIATSATLASAPNPSTPGQSVTITATITPAGATGTVTFFDGAAVLGTASAVGGMAMFSTSTLAIGTHALSAGYSGDVAYAPCSAPAITHEVKYASTTSLASAPNPSWFGQEVALTATVGPVAATGTVTFYDGASPIGTGAVSSGTATLNTSALAVGTHSLTASYGGDGSHLASTSSAVSHTVNQLTIASSAGANGSISPNGTTNVAYDGSQAYTITPAPCYAIADVLVDGGSVGAVSSYTFSNVTAPHTISASFVALGPYTIAASAGTGGAISPSGNTSVACDGSQAYTITADACHAIADVLVDGVSVGAVSSYTFNDVTANHTIAASFAPLGPYTIAASAGAGGAISPSGNTSAACDGSQAYTITADACYAIADVLVDGVSVGAVSSYTFNDVTANHTIAASFAPLGPFNIAAAAGTGGGISPAGNSSVPCDGSQTYTITAAACHTIADVLVDGVSVGAVG
ncbi:MAG TPA: Ig-like domain repeat protein, partial [Candidatus Eisenbacteria bacterium]|nr:Ig-like domain repeat protein [Candidatus Eisenbacteria bacterium]